ncbi:5'(3')-deoxyribonucleotidase [bacterium A37T11]|nr:5'(3')-deoxyribonucleotidase [bacterium A37T11]
MNNLRKPRIAVDMDEVMADTHAKFLNLYFQDYGIPKNIEQLPGKELHENLPIEIQDKWFYYINQKGFFRDLPVMPGAQEILKALTEHYEVYVVSAAIEFPNSMNDKLEWLEEFFPFINWTHILFTGHKIVDTDIMIDDRSKNFIGFKGRPLLYTSPHNQLLTEYERVNNWQEVKNKLL